MVLSKEKWQKHGLSQKKKKQDGRLDYKALEAHYGGEGNKAVRVQEAEVLRTTLHCKSERTMSFDKFLTNMQSMFAGFADNEEILTEAQKIRLLSAKVQSPTWLLSRAIYRSHTTSTKLAKSHLISSPIVWQ
jgi:hypothetical protein